MAETDKESRTEQASAKRLEEARSKGQVALSRDLTMAVSMMAGIALLSMSSGQGVARIVQHMREWLLLAGPAARGAGWSPEGLHSALLTVGTETLWLMLPFMVLVVGSAVGATVLQTGFIWKADFLSFDITKLNPLSGFQRLLAWRSVAELVKALIKVCLVAATAYAATRNEWGAVPGWVHLDLQGVLGTTGALTLHVALWVGLTLFLLASVDYAYQRYEWQRGLKMTKQELKEEARQSDGDPQVKARIRSIQRDLGRARMMAAVPKATVVITNPTHIAVALRYDQHNMAAPVVVAKGAGYVAERIREIARANGVMVIERPPLARSLFKLVDVGKEIPLDLYRAVAEILAMVFRAKQWRVQDRQ
ncbi:MAG: flagellar biosynthesis protein FlhB [Nitrospiraceae bacterium]